MVRGEQTTIAVRHHTCSATATGLKRAETDTENARASDRDRRRKSAPDRERACAQTRTTVSLKHCDPLTLSRTRTAHARTRNQVAEATRRARHTGRSVSIDVPNEALPAMGSLFSEALSLGGKAPSPPALSHTLGRKHSHKQRMAASTDAQIMDDADQVTGDGMRVRSQQQPVDEVCQCM